MEKIERTGIAGPAGLEYDAYQAVCMKLQAKARRTERPAQVIAVTGTAADDGQAAVAANLAVVMAKTGVRTLLLDGDLRAPALHDMFQLPNRGLTECLTAGTDYHELIQPVDGLAVVTGGAAAANAGELLSGKRMQELLQAVRGEYDYVFVNTAPVLASADAVSVSGKADGVILVIASGQHEAAQVRKAKTALEESGASLLGCILNRATEA